MFEVLLSGPEAFNDWSGTPILTFLGTSAVAKSFATGCFDTIFLPCYSTRPLAGPATAIVHYNGLGGTTTSYKSTDTAVHLENKAILPKI